MVRVISQGFSTPRSRHSSGEDMIDRFAAMKAVTALGDRDRQCLYEEDEDSLGRRALVIACDTDTTDSFSGADSDQEAKHSDDTAGRSGADTDDQPPANKKKQRRRERNKVSAQHYRQRRRQQGDAAQQTLQSLEVRHKVLLEQVQHLEAEKNIVQDYLKNCVKIPWCPYHHPCQPTNCPNPQTIPTQCPNKNTPQVGSMPLSMRCEDNMPLSMCSKDNMPLSMCSNDNMPLSMCIKDSMSMSMRGEESMSLRMSSTSPLESSGRSPS